MHFEDACLVVKYTREAILPDTQFLERTTSKWFEVVTRIAPLGRDYLVETEQAQTDAYQPSR